MSAGTRGKDNGLQSERFLSDSESSPALRSSGRHKSEPRHLPMYNHSIARCAELIIDVSPGMPCRHLSVAHSKYLFDLQEGPDRMLQDESAGGLDRAQSPDYDRNPLAPFWEKSRSPTALSWFGKRGRGRTGSMKGRRKHKLSELWTFNDRPSLGTEISVDEENQPYLNSKLLSPCDCRQR